MPFWRKYSVQQESSGSPGGLAQVQSIHTRRPGTMKPPIVLSSPQISLVVNGAVILNQVETLSWRQPTVSDGDGPNSIKVNGERANLQNSVRLIGLRMVEKSGEDGSMNGGGGPLTIRVRGPAVEPLNNHHAHQTNGYEEEPYDRRELSDDDGPPSTPASSNGHSPQHDELLQDYDEQQEEEKPTILSRRGTIRGKKNHVRASIAAFLEQRDTSKRQYTKEEEGKIVLYTTSMGIVRRTHDLCRRVRNILQTLMVRFEERDVFMNRDYQDEVKDRLSADQVLVPQVFVEGRFLGNADVVERLNECGELRRLLEPYKRQSVGEMCQKCGDFRFLPCTTCGGSKKSAQHKHQFSMDFIALRCMVCDENGLIKCDLCFNGDLY